MGNLAPRPEIEPTPPVVQAWYLNHWTTREVSPHFKDVETKVQKTGPLSQSLAISR